MSTASSTRSSLHHRGPYIPLIRCPECGLVVKRLTSHTPAHDGWVFFKCEKHAQGCNFFHWELEYVVYLLDNEILRGDAAVEALGWAEDRRLELKLKAEEQAATTPGHEQLMRGKAIGLVEEAVFLLKIVVALLVLVCVLVAAKK